MKYHDSIKQADKKMTLSVQQLQIWQLAASPINYAVSYDYVTGKNIQLNTAIEQHLISGKSLDNFFIEEVYRQFVLGQSKFRHDIVHDVEEVLINIQTNTQHSTKTINSFISSIEANIKHIQSSDKQKVSLAISELCQSSLTFKRQQQKLQRQLLITQQQTNALKNELEEVKKEIYLDPLTNLYNRKAMSQHLDIWLGEDPEKKFAAIVVNIDDFSQFNQRFGSLVSDVLLTKVAKKVSSYVDNSGLPVRSAGDEFIILLPDVEQSVAHEIAEKIKQGVKKLRFISNKSGVRFPQLTVSVGINEFKVTESVSTIIKKSRQMLDVTKHKQLSPALG
ncbi:MAG: GGDEF domain-containing protein [Alteromonadaceae bacterium]|nr:GGDEF domain-containing protein [Alteromonadaceae bacterium]